MNTTEKHYQDWLETYVALVLGENKAYTNFRRDACPGKFLHVKKFCNSRACAKKWQKKKIDILCYINYFYNCKEVSLGIFHVQVEEMHTCRFFSGYDSHVHADECMKRGWPKGPCKMCCSLNKHCYCRWVVLTCPSSASFSGYLTGNAFYRRFFSFESIAKSGDRRATRNNESGEIINQLEKTPTSFEADSEMRHCLLF